MTLSCLFPVAEVTISSIALTLSDAGVLLPDWETFASVLSLRSYNTRLVVLSTAILGVGAGVTGSFLLLRKRSLMADALSHSSLPGIAFLFLMMTALGGSGKQLPGLLAGAGLTGLAGVGAVLWIRRNTRIRDDAAMGIVLSVFFGFGVVLLGFIQSQPGAAAAGLETFIYGKTASMVFHDFLLLSAVAFVVIIACLLLLKEFTLLCFDEAYASARGWPVLRLDLLMLFLVTAITVAGLQAVGLILIIAFLIIPAAAARFWTDQVRTMMVLAAIIGGASGWIGASLSALLPRFPAGAVIVLTAVGFFAFSMAFGASRGIIRRRFRRYRHERRIGRQHLLRAALEVLEETHAETSEPLSNRRVRFEHLKGHRSWSAAELRRLIRQARREDHVEHFDGETFRLSESGFGEAARTTRNHRLWEQYLIEHAEIAPGHVDRDADAVEHILSADLVRKLEAKLKRAGTHPLPQSPHPLQTEKERKP